MYISFYLFFTAIWHFAKAGAPSCLQERANCLRNKKCASYFQSFESTCGYTLTKCSVPSMSDCVRDLQRIRDLMKPGKCVCYRALGFIEECDFFRQLVWNHPCERHLLDIGQERTMNEGTVPTSPSWAMRRTTRTPVADQVRELKTQLSGELATRELLGKATCDEALEKVCLRHVSCTQLWRLFRSSCGVDEENQCKATDRNVCWQAFEGLSWTGLANCRCESNNSDCHWIRLHTNYNKCIYEISKSGSIPLLPSQHWKQHNVEQYQRRYEEQYGQQWAITTPMTAPIINIPPTISYQQQQQLEAARRAEEARRLEAERQAEEARRLESERQAEEARRLEAERNENELRRLEAAQQAEEARRIEAERQAEEARHLEAERRAAEARRLEAVREEARRAEYAREEARKADEARRIEAAREEGRRLEAARQEALRQKQAEEEARRLQAEREEYERQRAEWMRFEEERKKTTTTAASWIPSIRATVTGDNRTAPSWWDPRTKRPADLNNRVEYRTSIAGSKIEELQYRPLETSTTQRPTPSKYYAYTTATTPRKQKYNSSSNRTPKRRKPTTTTTVGPTVSAVTALSTMEPFESSTCPQALSACERAEDCRWHLGELRARCGRVNCRREECAAALQRFSRYVPISLSEPVMFCQCAADDTSCQSQQSLLYPRCLYTTTMSSCSQAAARCASDARCRQLRSSITQNCPVDDAGGCTARSSSACRQALLAARGSILEQPCFCPLTDVSCVLHQRIMIPSNPCIEDAIRDYGEQQSLLLENEQHQTVDLLGESLTSNFNSKKDSTTTTTTTTAAPVTKPSRRTRPKHRTTTPAPTTTSTEAPPPWETTTTKTPATTTTFVTAPPPPAEGCQTRDASGRALFFPVGTVLRRYVDWSSRCSSYCECVSEEQLQCERLPCLEDGTCDAPLAKIDFGERIFLEDRGACFCESSNFICEMPEEEPEFYPGLYISVGFSDADIEMLRKEVPRALLDRAGLYSSDAATDVAGRLQVAFERLLPADLSCRLVLMQETVEPGHAFLRVEWFGQNLLLNHTKAAWHHGGAEKVCSPYTSLLYDLFVNSDSLRYQLVLSTVKQLKVLDYLDGLPTSNSSLCQLLAILISLFLYHF